MMKNVFLSKVEKYCEEKKLFSKGDNVVIGVSGGADSVALFLFLNYLKEKLSLKLYVVHVNHCLRKEAEEEALFVKALCDKEKVPFYLFKKDIIEISKEQSLGTEEAGRKVRYEAFYEVLSKVGGGKICVAHNQNDRAETFLFNLSRGTGAKGLSSIMEKRGEIVRPLLCVQRSEIEDFLKSEGVSFCVDSSNLSNDYTRNRIRNEILPMLVSNVNEAAVLHINEAAESIGELNNFIEGICEKEFEKIVIEQSPSLLVYNKGLFNEEDTYIKKLLVKKAIEALVSTNKDITRLHIESVISISSKDGNKSVNLPYLIKVTSSYDTLSFELDPKLSEKPEPVPIKFEDSTITFLGYTFSLKAVDCKTPYPYGKNQYTKCFSYDKIDESLVFRTRENGDYIVINAEGDRKKLKDYMIDEKIPLNLRDNIPLLAMGSEVIWVVGYRMSESVKVCKETKQVLEVSALKED